MSDRRNRFRFCVSISSSLFVEIQQKDEKLRNSTNFVSTHWKLWRVILDLWQMHDGLQATSRIHRRWRFTPFNSTLLVKLILITQFEFLPNYCLITSFKIRTNKENSISLSKTNRTLRLCFHSWRSRIAR